MDAYGQPIGVNYKGETTFKTGFGAVWTLLVCSFLLLWGINAVLGLLTYQNPAITQYTLYSDRKFDSPVNFADVYGEMVLVFIKHNTTTVIAPDPRIATVEMDTI